MKKNCGSKQIPSEVPKLTLEDFVNPLFDKQKSIKRYNLARDKVYHLVFDDYHKDLLKEDFVEELFRKNIILKERETLMEKVIEGVTFTDGFNQIGYTYHFLDGMLYLNYWDESKKKNVRLIETPINFPEDFNKCLKKADIKIQKYLSKNKDKL